MDFDSKKHLIHHGQNAFPPIQINPNSVTNFPIIAIIMIGMLATTFLLMVYYTFVIKCCLHWNHVDLVRARRFSLSRQHEQQSTAQSITSESRGLEESVIQSIPIIHYKTEKSYGERISSECAVCLNEFQQDEKLRVIPNCSHLFHIDCIDIWLQNNANCPLCRRRVSLTKEVQVVEHVQTPRPSPYNESQNVENIVGGYDDFVVIDLDNNEHNDGQNLHERREERGKEIEVPRDSISLSHKKAMKLQKVTSMGDECINIKDKEDGFLVQPIRRSYSMDLSVKKSLYQENLHDHEVNFNDVCGDSSSKSKRSFFSFGHGSRSRSFILPIHLDP